MSKTLVLNISGSSIPIQIEKLDRESLYGKDFTQVTSQGHVCKRVLTLDGQVIDNLQRALILPDGSWIDKDDVTPYLPDGTALQKSESSFKSEQVPTWPKLDDILDYNIEAVYAVDWDSPQWPACIDFTYNSGYAKKAFLIVGADNNACMLVGNPAPVEWVGAKSLNVETEDEDWDMDDLDTLFG